MSLPYSAWGTLLKLHWLISFDPHDNLGERCYHFSQLTGEVNGYSGANQTNPRGKQDPTPCDRTAPCHLRIFIVETRSGATCPRDISVSKWCPFQDHGAGNYDGLDLKIFAFLEQVVFGNFETGVTDNLQKEFMRQVQFPVWMRTSQ